MRRLKLRALRASFERFLEREWRGGGDRDRALRGYLSEQAWWIEDYGLFRAMHAREQERPWTEWPARAAAARSAGHRSGAPRARRRSAVPSVPAVAGRQRSGRRRAQHSHGVALFGDLPFMVDSDSADVWARQHQFRLDMSVGAPPDAFSATGQDWGMPVYRWDALAAEDFRWLRERARRSADLFDGYRVDHLVGFYRTYGAAATNGGDRRSSRRPTSRRRRALGETVLDLFRAAGAEIIAEDLGTVPDFVRASLARLGVPGFRVLSLGAALAHRRASRSAIRRSIRPSRWPRPGTHDTEPIVVWWDSATEDERRKVGSLPTIQRLAAGVDLTHRPFDATVRDVLLEVALRVAVRAGAAAGAGRVRLARSHQRAGDRHRRQLDVPAAVAGGSAGRDTRGARAAGTAARLVRALRTS